MQKKTKLPIATFMEGQEKSKIYMHFYASNERAKVLASIQNMFNMSRPDIMIKGMMYMLEKQSLVEDNISIGNHLVAYNYPYKHRIMLKKPKKTASKCCVMYIYDIMYDTKGYYTVIYKDSIDSLDLSFKTMRKRKHTIDDAIMDMFPQTYLTEGIPD